MTPGRSASDIVVLFQEMAADFGAAEDGNAVMDAIVAQAIRRVDGAERAGITVGRAGQRFSTVAATDDLVRKCDQIQYDLASGPCVDAIIDDTTYNAPDLRTDSRWPEFGRRCVEQTGIVSMLSIRLYIEADEGVIAGLNMYSHATEAFDEESESIAHLLATHGSTVVAKAAAEAKARNLARALETSREIGIAIGIVMAYEKVTREQAFDLLRIVSQKTHRKVHDIAAEVTETGALPELPHKQPE